VLDVTKFKTKAEWAEDPMKDVDTKTKSAFTRTFNKTVSVGCVVVVAVNLPVLGARAGWCPACYWQAESRWCAGVEGGGVCLL
jgi:hypothetical protein